MIFDIYGTVSFKSPFEKFPLDKPFDDRFYNDVVGQRYQKKSINSLVSFLFRDGFKNDFFEDKELYLITIGAAFLNAAGSNRFNEPVHRLSSGEILKLYQDLGKNFIDCLKGNFQIIVFKEKESVLSIFNSRFGVSPFYYSLGNSTIIFSTNLMEILACSSCKNEPDNIGIAEYAIFGYPLGNRTFYRNIKALLPAERLVIQKGSIEQDRYWDCRSLIGKDRYSEKEALDIGGELFERTVNVYAGERGRICSSLTGGFDGRTMLAVLKKRPEDLLCYSFGISGSLNISIPQKICREMDLKFLPIYLDGEYEKVYDRYALKAIYFSDCLATLERANYPYAFEKLCEFSPIVVTGIFGSELMRTFQNVSIGYMVNDNFVELNFAKDKKRALISIIEQVKNNSYFDPSIFENGKGLFEHIYGECMNACEEFTDNQRFFLFLLKEGVRKYFGAEVHMERIYAENRFPFLDDDFVEFVFKSPFAGIYSNPLNPSIRQRFQSQYFYALLIKRYKPQLLNFTTDHGYPPRYLLSRAALFKMIPGLVLKKARRIFTDYREFKIEEWSADFYRSRISAADMTTPVVSSRLQNDYADKKWLGNRAKFAQAVSLLLYLKMSKSL